MSLRVYIIGTIIFGIITIICSIYSVICYIKKFSLKFNILSILISVGSLSVTLFASFHVNIPPPIILPLDNEVQVYGGSTKISIESDEKGCEIYYTLNGKDPKNSGEKYNGTFYIFDSTTVCARNKFGFWWSNISERSFSFNVHENSSSYQPSIEQNIFNKGIFFGDINNSNANKNNYSIEENNTFINVNDITIQYAILSDDRFKNVYVQDYTDLSLIRDKYYLENNCAFILNISNQNNHVIKLNKFRIIANNINQDLKPNIIIDLISQTESNIELYVSNCGWSDANNIKIEIMDADNILLKYFDQEDLAFEISKLKFGDYCTIPLIDYTKIKKYPNIEDGEFIIINLLANIFIDNKNTSFIKIPIPLYLYNDRIEIDYIGGNETFFGVYGIEINSNLNEDTIEFGINESIEAKDILDIPICFFPNKSCSMDFCIEFDIFNGYYEETIRSDLKKIKFNVSSINAQYINYNKNLINLQRICDSEDKYYISYPDNYELNPINIDN